MASGHAVRRIVRRLEPVWLLSGPVGPVGRFALCPGFLPGVVQISLDVSAPLVRLTSFSPCLGEGFGACPGLPRRGFLFLAA